MELPKPAALPSEQDSIRLRALDETWRTCPKETYRLNTVRAGHLFRIAFHRICPQPQRPLLVFVHGVLSDHQSWRFVAGQLASEFEIWLVDLPGFGDSDAPSPKSLEPDGYSANAMAERILQGMEAQLAQEIGGHERRITLVGHSFGGMVCLRMISDPEVRRRHQSLIGQIDRAVLMSTCEFTVNSIPSWLLPVLELNGLKVSAAEFLGIFDAKTRSATETGYFSAECATREQQAALGNALRDRGHRQATAAMVCQTVPFDFKTRRPKLAEMQQLMQDCEKIDKPVLILWGMWDEALPSSMGHELKDRIPGATLVEIPGCGHALPSEAPETCAGLIREFQQGLATGTVLGESGLKIKIYGHSQTGIKLGEL